MTWADHERWEDAAGTLRPRRAARTTSASATRRISATCADCRAEVAELRVAAEALPVSPPPMLPPPALKARIMAEVEREAALLASAGQPRRAPRRTEAREAPLARRLRAARAPRWRAGLRALLRRARRRRAAVRRRRRAHDRRSSRRMPQASAELEVTDDGATLVANGLPPPPAGKTYMVWLKRPGHAPEPTSALFTPRRDGSATASRDRRPGRRRERAGQHRAARRLDDADVSPSSDRHAHASAIASSPRTSRSSANSKRSSVSPAIEVVGEAVSVGNCSGGSEREVLAELLRRRLLRRERHALLVGERADVEGEHVRGVGDHPRRQRRRRQHAPGCARASAASSGRSGSRPSESCAASRRLGQVPARGAGELLDRAPASSPGRARAPAPRRRSGPAAGSAAPPCRRRASTATRRRRRAPARAGASRGPAGRRARAAPAPRRRSLARQRAAVARGGSPRAPPRRVRYGGH